MQLTEHTTSGAAAELPLPSFDAAALVRRAGLLAAVAAVAVAAVLAAGGPLRAFAGAVASALHADPRWVAAAGLCEVLSVAGYMVLLCHVAGRATPRLGLRESAQVTLAGAAATRLLPTAGLGGAAVTLWTLRRSGLEARAAARTLLAVLVVLYAVFLAAIAGCGLLVALGAAGGRGPAALSAVPAAAAVGAIVVALVLGVRFGRGAPAPGGGEPAPGGGDGRGQAGGPGLAGARALARIRAGARLLGLAVRDALSLVRAGDVRLLGAVAWWAGDAAVLWATLHACGAQPGLAVIGLAYFVGQVCNTLPIPGAVSGGMAGALIAFGVAPALALTAVLAYRAIAIWLPAPLGLAALPGLRATVARWAREDGVARRAGAGAPDASIA